MAERGRQKRRIVDAVLAADAVQMMLNPFFHHAFLTETTTLENAAYYRLLPLAGQTVHRVVDYAVFLIVLGIFIYRVIHSPKVDVERYAVILAAMVFMGLWETFYIFSRTPIDRSMIGFGILGVLVYYFAIHYRPLKLLDRMLSGIVSNGKDACFIFTPRGRCVWVNNAAGILVGVSEENCDKAPEYLEYLFNINLHRGNWSEQHTTGAGDSVKYYNFENRDVVNEKGRITGYYLMVKDVTEEQLRIRKDLYEATHDILTGLYTKDQLFKIIKQNIDIHKDIDYMALYINIKSFKLVNDIF
jgi:PAS domain-containing protein